MKWTTILISLYLTYYTIRFGIMTWHENKKFASIIIWILAINLIILPFVVGMV